MNREGRNQAGTLFWGITLIAIGILFLLERMDMLDLHDVLHTYWPLFIVLIGISNVVCRSLWRGLWFIGIGVWMQIITLGLFGLTFSNSWPLLLIVVGAGMVFRTFLDLGRRRSREREFSRGMEERHDER